MLQSPSCSSSPNINSYSNRSPLVIEDSQQSSSSTSSSLFSTTIAVDLTKSNKSDILQSQSQHHPQQRTVICPPTIQSNPKQKPSVGMDLSLSSLKTTTPTGTAAPTLPSVITGCSIQNNNGPRLGTIESTNKNIPAPPHHSRQIKKVLKHYQAAATLSLNGPDWFLPIYSNGSSAGVNCDGNGGSSITSSSSTSSTPPPPPPPVIVNSNDTTTATIWADKSGASNGGGGIGSAPQVISSNFVDDNKIVVDGCGSKSSLSTAAAAAPPPTSSLVDLRTNRHQQQPSSLSSISSPSSLAAVAKTTLKDYDPLLRPPPFPIQQPPLLTPPDHGDPKQSERLETFLEGELIACFMVGGERRLCVPQIFNIVLRDFALHQINQVIEELQINCSTCTRDQMDVLKHSGDIPPMAPSCGLITKTDAHRLCSTLLCNGVSSTTFHNNHVAGSCGPSPAPPPIHLLNTPYILIYHECFGRCVGRYAPSLYTHPSALCIQCDDCMSLFTPYGFVCHSHRPRENRTVHWGFDPNNWRSYLLPIEDLVTYDSVVIPLNHQDALLTDTMNLSQIMKLVNNNNQSPNGNDFKPTPPCCTGGWKSMTCHQKQRANTSFDKNLDQIRSLMKEMKNRFAKSLPTNDNSNASLKLSNKRKEMFQDGTGNQNRCLASNPETLSNSSQNKRIKSEPLDLHCPTGGGNAQPVSSSLMSSLVYPFLQSYLTSGMIPANVGTPKPSKPSVKPSSVDQSSIMINNGNSQTQRAPITTSASATAATNYLSALLTGSSSNTSTTLTGNNSSTPHNPSSIFADFMNHHGSVNQTSTAMRSTSAEGSSVANHKNNSQTAKLSKELASFFAATAAATPVSGHQNPFYSDGGQMLSDIGHYHTNSSYHQQPTHQNSHPIDRLLNNHTNNNANDNNNSKPLSKSDCQNGVGSQIAMIPKTKALIVNEEEQEEKCLLVDQTAKMVGDRLKSIAGHDSNQKSLLNQLQPKNCHKSSASSSSSPLLLSMNSSLLPETSVILSNSNNHHQDDIIRKEKHPKFCSDHLEKVESSPHSLRVQHDANFEEVDEKLGQISPTSLMEGNLYNTIHMLQKMRHLSFELGMVPNLFEPKFNNLMSAKNCIPIQQAESEVETRIQMLGQIIKDSSYEALKRNLSMIEYLIDDILVHLINNNHQIPSNGSIIMERFKERMFQNILDFLDEIFAEKVADNEKSSLQQQTHANNTQKYHLQQQQSRFKMENTENEEKYGFERDGEVESSKLNTSAHTDDVEMDKVNDKNDKENCIKKVDNDKNSIVAEQEQFKQDSSASQSSVQIIENNDNQNESDSEMKGVQESSLPTTQALISTERSVATPLSSSSSSLSSVSSPKPASPTTFNKNNDTTSLIQNSINEQLTNAISTLAATVSAAAAAASVTSDCKSSSNNNDIIVPSFLYHLNQQAAASSSSSTGFHHFIGHHHRMPKANFGDGHGLASVGDKGTTSPITTAAAAATVPQQPMLLTTGSPN